MKQQPPPPTRNNQRLLLRLDSNPNDRGGFVAGLDLDEHNVVVHTAPIVHWMRGWTAERVFDYCSRKGWECKAYLLWEP